MSRVRFQNVNCDNICNNVESIRFPQREQVNNKAIIHVYRVCDLKKKKK